MTPRRARLVLVLVVLGVVGVGVFAWEPVYDCVSRRRLLVEEADFEYLAASQLGEYGEWAGHPVRGWSIEDRWTGRLCSVDTLAHDVTVLMHTFRSDSGSGFLGRE